MTFRFFFSRGEKERERLCWKENEEEKEEEEERTAAVVRRATACPEEHPLRGRVCDDGMHARAWFCKLEDYFTVTM